ncbi:MULTISPECIES: hypothetical protein [unclassified Rathayibacter]|uniref:hypothetical protein n=1 Tax=unclassified Rathayibacter TaxID=2609250 RepID=UPI000CE771C5|nr:MULTISPECIES: hypothetical protein [unclassified Rathayibacter]PPI39247.1 hypothetical protein C5D50_08775 [Rathayibacter sp. RFBD1]PPI57281.1 hypothetical protein C5D38_08355 [Rathayibacter sp. TRS19]
MATEWEWVPYVSGGVGAVTGLYGTWRAHRNSREAQILRGKWRFEPQMTDRSSYLLRNLMLRSVTAVKVSAPKGCTVLENIGDRVVSPGEAVQINVLIFPQSAPGPLMVE